MTENKRYSHNHLGVIFDNTRYDVAAMSVKEIVDSLNRLTEENEHLKHMIQEAYETERTQLGQSVLKQLMEAIK